MMLSTLVSSRSFPFFSLPCLHLFPVITLCPAYIVTPFPVAPLSIGPSKYYLLQLIDDKVFKE
jgi:hypothetical protein